MKKLPVFLLLLLALSGAVHGETLLCLPEDQPLITRPGVYRVKGRLPEGQMLIDCGREDEVILILDGLEIHSPAASALEVKRAGRLRVVLEAGSRNALRAGAGAKAAFFSKAELIVEGSGALSLEAAGGHGIHGKGDVSLKDGSVHIRALKNGVKAGGALSVLGGRHVIEDSREGLEGDSVLVTGGSLDIRAREDGVNAAGKKDPDPRRMDDPGGRNHWIRVQGGSLVIRAQGDGLDANGDLVITGGDIRISGPVSGQDGALDAHGEITISGGSLMAFGAADRAEGARDAGQSASLIRLARWVMGGQEVRLKNAAGESLLVFTPAYPWNSAVLSHPGIKKGEPCSLWAADSKLADFVMGEEVFLR